MVVTNYIRNLSVSSTVSDLNTNITHVAVGDGTSVPVVSNTTLGNETYREAKFESDTLTAFYEVSLYLDTTENNSNTINEIGTFNASSGGTMYSHDLTTSFAKTSSKEAFYTIVINVSAGNT